MYLKFRFRPVLLALTSFVFANHLRPPQLFAAEPPAPGHFIESSPDSRYGPLNLFDHRSMYGKGTFPEPFLIDDSDLENNEVRFDWLHQEGKGHVADFSRIELEKGFGLLTLELEIPYERDTTRLYSPLTRRTNGSRSEGLGNINIAARHPVYQFVSRDESIDSTFGVAVEVGIPTNSIVSKNAEFVPKIFNDLRLGEHFTLQTVLGYSFLRGASEAGGAQAFEYGLVFGYAIPHKELPLPGIDRIVPMFEIKGETATNHGAGHNILRGNAALRLNLKAIGRLQPRLGVGYVFPIDSGAKDELRWGVYTSLVFEF